MKKNVSHLVSAKPVLSISNSWITFLSSFFKVSRFEIFLFAFFFVFQASAANKCLQLFEKDSTVIAPAAPAAPTAPATPEQQLSNFLHLYDATPDVPASRPPMKSAHLLKNGSESSNDRADQLSFNPRNVNPKAPLFLVPEVVESRFPYPEFLGNRLTFENENYLLINVGHRQLSRDWAAIEKAVQKGQDLEPEKNIAVQMSERWLRGRQTLSDWSAKASAKVVSVYKVRKPYLTELHRLQLADKNDKQNDDFFILLKDKNKSALELKEKDFDSDVLAVIRLARMQSQDPAFPYKLVSKYLGSDELPASYRKQFKLVDQAKMIFSKLQKDKNLRIGEISRFVKFQEFPPQIMATFLKQLFTTAVSSSHPLDLLIISVDPLTRRLFKNRYNFQDLVTIESKHEGKTETEYLMYLDTRTEAFKEMYAKFKPEMDGVSIASPHTTPPKQAWSLPWNNVDRYSNTKPNQANKPNQIDIRRIMNFGDLLSQGKELVKRYRNQHLEKMLQQHVQLGINGLRPTKVLSAHRVQEIVEFALSAQGSLALKNHLSSLSGADKNILFKNTDLFSSDWAKIIENIETTIGDKTNIAIYGQNAAEIKSILEAQQKNRNIQVGTLDKATQLNQHADISILIDTLWRLSANDQTQMLKQITPTKAKSSLALVEPFESSQRPDGLTARIEKYAHDLWRNQAPMTEVELALALTQVKERFITCVESNFNQRNTQRILNNLNQKGSTTRILKDELNMMFGTTSLDKESTQGFLLINNTREDQAP